jgi:hypothetical protein
MKEKTGNKLTSNVDPQPKCTKKNYAFHRANLAVPWWIAQA